MNLKFKNKTQFKIKKNPYNKVFFPKGMFLNIPKIKHNNIWYDCFIKFEENTLIISRLILHQNDSSIVKVHIEGEFHREKIPSWKRNLIQFKYNTHPINYKIYNIKKKMFLRRKTIFVFISASVLSVIYCFINLYSKNWLMNWIGTSLIAQTIIIFLTLSGFVNIFTPFTIAKEITEKDILEIAQKTFEKKKEEDENTERKIRDNSF